MVHPEEIQDEEKQDTVFMHLHSQGAYQTNDFKNPDSYIFPYIEKC